VSEYSFKVCTDACKELETSCPNIDCKHWIDYEDDCNCTLIAVENHGPMTLREISDRLQYTFVRVKQIQDDALEKLQDVSINNDYL